MALIQCPECEGKVSDKAQTCPHCGCPISSPQQTTRTPAVQRPKPPSRMRLPNGFGSISYLGPRRREPYYVRKTVGRTPFGKPIQRPIEPKSSFKTYNEAYQALMEYNKTPYDKKHETTIAQAYEEWAPKYFTQKNLSEGRKKAWRDALRACTSIHNKKLRELKTVDLDIAIQQSSKSSIIRIDVRSLLINLYDWALKYEIVEKNYAKMTDVVSRPDASINRIVFPDREVQQLWKMLDMECADMVLVGLYTGLRPGEICTLESENVILKEHYMVGGSKTEAGKDRIIPIHDKIYNLIAQRADAGKLFKIGADNVTYNMYAHRFRAIMADMKTKHTPHDTRHTFVTKAKTVGMDEYCLKLIVGHAIQDLTENVYTHRTPAELLREVNKINYDI